MASPLPPVREPLFTARFAMLWAYAFITFFSAFQLLPAIPLRILELGGTKAQAGWFLTVYTLCSAFAAPVMGTIADHIGRRRLLIIASVVFVGFSVAYGVIRDLRLLLLVGAVHGSMWSGILASASAIMSEFIPESRRAQGLAWWGLSSTAAVSLGPAIGLWVYHFGWVTLCIELAVLSTVMAIWAMFIPARHTPDPSRRLAITDAWDWGVIKTTLSFAVLSFGYGGITSYSAIVAIENHVKPEAIYLTTFAATIVVVRVTLSQLVDRVGIKRVLYPSLALAPVAFGILAISQVRWEMMLSAILFGICFGLAYPAFATFILGNTDPARRARTFGSMVWAFDIGIGVGSFGVGAIGHRYGLGAAFAFSAVLSCLSIPIFAWTSRRLEDSGTSLAGEVKHVSPAE
jgi:MFS family permease